MAHRKKERIKKIRDVPGIPGGPFWRRLGPYGPFIPLIPKVAKELAVLMTKHEEAVGLGHGPKFDPTVDWDAATRKEQQEARWAEMDFERSEIKTGEVIQSLIDKFAAIVNDNMIQLTPEDLEVINDPEIVMTPDGEIARRLVPKGRLSKGRRVIAKSGQFARHMIMPDLPTKKKKRKVSSYSKQFGIELKKLKAKHPRTPVTRLMKRAHAATRKARK